MAYFLWIGVSLAIVYGLISALSGVVQFKERQIPMWSALLITIVGGTLVTSALFLLINPKMIIILILCLVFMHVAAIVNGFHLYGKINLMHHIIRFSLSAVIIVLLWG